MDRRLATVILITLKVELLAFNRLAFYYELLNSHEKYSHFSFFFSYFRCLIGWCWWRWFHVHDYQRRKCSVHNQRWNWKIKGKRFLYYNFQKEILYLFTTLILFIYYYFYFSSEIFGYMKFPERFLLFFYNNLVLGLGFKIDLFFRLYH